MSRSTLRMGLAFFFIPAAIFRFVPGVVAENPGPAPQVVRSYPAPEERSLYRVGNPRVLAATIDQLQPLHRPLRKPQPGEWLDRHVEPGQTFAEYLRSRPVTPTGQRAVIYVLPLGEFPQRQRQIIDLTAEYLGLYFDRPVKVLKDLPLEIIPESARRMHPRWGVKQIQATYILNDVLLPRLPEDAASSIAFTASDLWPGGDWNFVFGMASLQDRVGVWSIHRFGDPAESDEAYRLCLRRTLKVATHETGHMFSLAHCTAYECNMCGSNHLEEADRRPMYLCPQCHAKICWATGADPAGRCVRLAAFCQQHGLIDLRTYYDRAATVLKARSAP